MLRLARYASHRLLRTGPIRLVMTLLVKNEVDIIEDNVRAHAALGVDAFLVMDNGSSDGTRELLEKLAQEFELVVIDQQEQTYQQSRWMTELAFRARAEMGADWVISNDADEFWIPASGDLKQGLCRGDALITCPRSNVLLTKAVLQPGCRYFDNVWRVNYPIFYDVESQKRDLGVSMLLTKISPKVMVNPYGLKKIKGGNHRAKHAMQLFKHREAPEIRVYHYPIRSWEQFERNITNRIKLLRDKRARMGPHYHRWVKIAEEGGLREEFERLVIDDADLVVLEKYGVVVQDESVRSILKRFHQR